MTDPVPSKELFTDLSLLRASGFDDAADEITRLREDNRRWENAHKILLAENERLRRQVDELSVHAEKWVKRALDRESVFASPSTKTFSITPGQVSHYTQPPSRYTVEPHGDGHALYFGRDDVHHGWNLAHITEATEQTLKLIEQALNDGAAQPPRDGQA